jgi:hypothetical protein
MPGEARKSLDSNRLDQCVRTEKRVFEICAERAIGPIQARLVQ